MRVDIRSTSMAEMERLEAALRQSLARAVEEESQATERRAPSQRHPFGLSSEVVAIGNRPAGQAASRMPASCKSFARSMPAWGTRRRFRAFTDANIPLSLGREAIAIGGGGAGGGAHTLQEWFDCSGRELGTERIRDGAGAGGRGFGRLTNVPCGTQRRSVPRGTICST